MFHYGVKEAIKSMIIGKNETNLLVVGGLAAKTSDKSEFSLQKMGLFGGYVWSFWGCGGAPKGQRCGNYPSHR